MSLGKHKSSKFDFTKISRAKLCNKFAAEIGIPEFELSELAKHYGYTFHQVEKRGVPKKEFHEFSLRKSFKNMLVGVFLGEENIYQELCTESRANRYLN